MGAVGAAYSWASSRCVPSLAKKSILSEPLEATFSFSTALMLLASTA